ncbi:uncharacterized protein ASCRUDRAFT_140318 [Ascoidea rubescens DSM 1968]|uniref:Ubiquitin-like domain-containing protein n=1 Tax=Ascoidea rubescens DSM 1968 TaxID=1344418 RepID=A0A1D2VKA8_9ASCO|nr:hypothetical protein ASCRUDRAFT_140318 [Ascoidea rubescens DSM 1968]ODV62052.1 hypothetical protein ASCRUDRAFT_140318 [Ascoidea rubescens DSM 1968]
MSLMASVSLEINKSTSSKTSKISSKIKTRKTDVPHLCTWYRAYAHHTALHIRTVLHKQSDIHVVIHVHLCGHLNGTSLPVIVSTLQQFELIFSCFFSICFFSICFFYLIAIVHCCYCLFNLAHLLKQMASITNEHLTVKVWFPNPGDVPFDTTIKTTLSNTLADLKDVIWKRSYQHYENLSLNDGDNDHTDQLDNAANFYGNNNDSPLPDSESTSTVPANNPLILYPDTYNFVFENLELKNDDLKLEGLFLNHIVDFNTPELLMIKLTTAENLQNKNIPSINNINNINTRTLYRDPFLDVNFTFIQDELDAFDFKFSTRENLSCTIKSLKYFILSNFTKKGFLSNLKQSSIDDINLYYKINFGELNHHISHDSKEKEKGKENLSEIEQSNNQFFKRFHFDLSSKNNNLDSKGILLLNHQTLSDILNLDTIPNFDLNLIISLNLIDNFQKKIRKDFTKVKLSSPNENNLSKKVIMINNSDTIIDLKFKITQLYNPGQNITLNSELNTDDIKIIYRGKFLRDDLIFKDFNVIDSSLAFDGLDNLTLHFVISQSFFERNPQVLNSISKNNKDINKNLSNKSESLWQSIRNGSAFEYLPRIPQDDSNNHNTQPTSPSSPSSPSTSTFSPIPFSSIFPSTTSSSATSPSLPSPPPPSSLPSSLFQAPSTLTSITDKKKLYLNKPPAFTEHLSGNSFDESINFNDDSKAKSESRLVHALENSSKFYIFKVDDKKIKLSTSQMIINDSNPDHPYLMLSPSGFSKLKTQLKEIQSIIPPKVLLKDSKSSNKPLKYSAPSISNDFHSNIPTPSININNNNENLNHNNDANTRNTNPSTNTNTNPSPNSHTNTTQNQNQNQNNRGIANDQVQDFFENLNNRFFAPPAFNPMLNPMMNPAFQPGQGGFILNINGVNVNITMDDLRNLKNYIVSFFRNLYEAGFFRRLFSFYFAVAKFSFCFYLFLYPYCNFKTNFWRSVLLVMLFLIFFLTRDSLLIRLEEIIRNDMPEILRPIILKYFLIYRNANHRIHDFFHNLGKNLNSFAISVDRIEIDSKEYIRLTSSNVETREPSDENIDDIINNEELELEIQTVIDEIKNSLFNDVNNNNLLFNQYVQNTYLRKGFSIAKRFTKDAVLFVTSLNPVLYEDIDIVTTKRKAEKLALISKEIEKRRTTSNEITADNSGAVQTGSLTTEDEDNTTTQEIHRRLT